MLWRSKVPEHLLSDWLKRLAFGLNRLVIAYHPSVNRWLTLGKLFNFSEVFSSVTIISYIWGCYLSMCFFCVSLRMAFVHKEDFSGIVLVLKVNIQFQLRFQKLKSLGSGGRCHVWVWVQPLTLWPWTSDILVNIDSLNLLYNPV